MRAILLLIIISFAALPTSAGTSIHAEFQPRDSITLKKLLSDIAKENVYEIATGQASSIQMKRGNLLRRQAPFDLLKISMDNANPVVRLYAFKALTEKMDNIPAEAALKFKNDSTPVTVITARGKQQLPVSQIANGFLK